MADFLILPSRRAVGEKIARLIRAYVPGVRISAEDCLRFLVDVAERDGRTFLVYWDDLPGVEDVTATLRDGFGVEPSDRVVMVGWESFRPRLRAASL
jgi:hypothetical protein